MKIKLLLSAFLVAVFVIGFVYDHITTSTPKGDAITMQNDANLAQIQRKSSANLGIMPPPDANFVTLNIASPDLAWKDIFGVEFDLGKLEADVVLVNFWASWCAPCLEEFPSMFDRVNAEGGKVALVAISTDRKEENIHAFFKKLTPRTTQDIHQPNIHWLWDGKQEISLKKFNTLRVPETFILKRENGRYHIRGKVAGIADWREFDLGLNKTKTENE